MFTLAWYKNLAQIPLRIWRHDLKQTTEIVAPTIVQRDLYRILCKTGSSTTPLALREKEKTQGTNIYPLYHFPKFLIQISSCLD